MPSEPMTDESPRVPVTWIKVRGSATSQGLAQGFAELDEAGRMACCTEAFRMLREKGREGFTFDGDYGFAMEQERDAALVENRRLREALESCVRAYDHWADPAHDDETDAVQMRVARDAAFVALAGSGGE